MRRKYAAILACFPLAALILGLCGASLADPAAGEESAVGGDRLIGAFVTREPLDLFDLEGYRDDPAADWDEGRLYATRTETDGAADYVFEGVEGTRCMAPTLRDGEGEYTKSLRDPALADNRIEVKSTDSGTSIVIEAKMYAAVGGPEDIVELCVNPVYQTPDGRVYLVPGHITSTVGDSEGMTLTQTVNENWTTHENGTETGRDEGSVTVELELVAPPERIAVVQFGERDQVLSRVEYAPDAVPEALTPEAGCAYLVVETTMGETVDRAVYDREDESLEHFVLRDDGLCVEERTRLDWPEK